MDMIDGRSLCLICLVVTMAYMFNIIFVLWNKIEHKEYRVKSIEEYLAKEATQQQLRLEELQAKYSTIKDDNSEIRTMIVSFHESYKNRVKSIDDTVAALGKSLVSCQNKAITNGVNIDAIQKRDMQTETKIIEMKTENMKQIQNLKDTVSRLHSDHNGVEKHEMQTEYKITAVKIEIMKQIQDLKDTITRLNSDQNGLKDDFAEIKINLKETFGKIFDETKEVYKVTEHIHERINTLDVKVNSQYETSIVSLIKSGISRLAQLAVDLFLGQPVIKYIE